MKMMQWTQRECRKTTNIPACFAVAIFGLHTSKKQCMHRGVYIFVCIDCKLVKI